MERVSCIGDCHITRLGVSPVLTRCMLHQISKHLPSINSVMPCTFALRINRAGIKHLTRLCMILIDKGDNLAFLSITACMKSTLFGICVQSKPQLFNVLY